MNFKKSLLVGVFLTISVSAFAHQGVKNPAVQARMDSMSEVSDATKVIANMAKGSVAFDQATAQTAAKTIAALAGKTPALFKQPETDPMSEALPAIWERFDDFEKKAGDMEAAALKAVDGISDLASLRSALGEIGATCKGCHSDYRK